LRVFPEFGVVLREKRLQLGHGVGFAIRPSSDKFLLGHEILVREEPLNRGRTTDDKRRDDGERGKELPDFHGAGKERLNPISMTNAKVCLQSPILRESIFLTRKLVGSIRPQATQPFLSMNFKKEGEIRNYRPFPCLHLIMYSEVHATIGWILVQRVKGDLKFRASVTLAGLLPELDVATHLLGSAVFSRYHHPRHSVFIRG
jgi:hypothetical protein